MKVLSSVTASTLVILLISCDTTTLNIDSGSVDALKVSKDQPRSTVLDSSPFNSCLFTVKSSGNGQSCMTCKPGFNQVDGKCLTLSAEECLEFGEHNQCLKKKQENGNGVEERTLQDNACLKKGDLRFKYACIQCNSLYYPDGNSCYKLKIANCVASKGINDCCSQCSPNYQLLNHKRFCRPPTVPNCSTPGPHPKGCPKCNNLYYVDGNGMCSRVTMDKCTQSHGVKDICLICESPYFVLGGVCTTTNSSRRPMRSIGKKLRRRHRQRHRGRH